MSSLVYLVLTLLAAASAAPGSRIVGGTPTTIEQFPYIVALVYTYPGPGITVQRCVGSLVSSWHVLTTGFCFTGAINDNMQIRAGSTNSLSGGTVVALSDVIKHPNYMETPRVADIAVVYMRTALPITDTIGVLFLPPQGGYIADGQQVKVVSWGFEYIGGPQLETLKTVNLYKLSLADCLAQYTGITGVAIVDEVICAAAPGRGICNGDSGAPMAVDAVSMGLSSYYHDCDQNLPEVFTRIDRYTNWILEVATAPSRSDAVGIRSVPVVTL